jgi:hypothetical protein
MIIDKLAAESPWIQQVCRRSRIVQAPFAIFPPHESRLTSKASLVPKDGDVISGQFAKPPCENVVIFGNGEEGREQGALFVQAAETHAVDKELLRFVPEDTTHVLLVTVAGLTERFDCLVVYRFLTYCGTHFAAPPHKDLIVDLSRQAFVDVNGFPPERAGAVFDIDETDWSHFVQHQVGALAALFALMNCKNVVREASIPDRKLQRARQRSGKIPLLAFSTLKVQPLGGKSARDGSGAPRAIHWVRGHFKEYTAERPLFGKLSGLFWWEPHLAGKADAVA